MRTILIVDDNLEASRPVQLLLQRFGHHCACTGSGEEALSFLRLHSVDLILLDAMMPGMDGMEVLRILRSDTRWHGVPIVMYTAVADDGFRQHALAKGANEYWIKASFDFSKLEERIDKLLAKKPSIPETALQ